MKRYATLAGAAALAAFGTAATAQSITEIAAGDEPGLRRLWPLSQLRVSPILWQVQVNSQSTHR